MLAPWFLVAPFVALAGGLVSSTDLRTALWAVSLAIDVAGALGVGRAGFRVSPGPLRRALRALRDHRARRVDRRHRGRRGRRHRDLTFAVTVAIAFAGAAALWWAYFDFVALAAERSLRFAPPAARADREPGTCSRSSTTRRCSGSSSSPSARRNAGSPLEPLPASGRAALVLGGSLPLLATILGRYRVTRHVAWERVGGNRRVVVVGPMFRDLDAAWLSPGCGRDPRGNDLGRDAQIARGPERRSARTAADLGGLGETPGCAAGPRWTSGCCVLGRPDSAAIGASCVLASERPAHPVDERRSAKPS